MDLNMLFHPNDSGDNAGNSFPIKEKGLQMMGEEEEF